ncbi:hypothetical protein F4861DRAFT_546829 [Xylaria intraflava]|nr:hypothetical protein F4861DRAFT_546829 [Xylaria intraflava]
MNRLCQSSYGSLEAVINLANFDGDGRRKLVHFSRQRATGEWSACAVVSDYPSSGGSIIQNVSKRCAGQDHGDFEVLVLENGGAVRHYTRDNTILDDYAWKRSATVNSLLNMNLPNTNSTDAAPLVQSQISMGSSTDGTCLETAILEDTGSMVHYRCPQHQANNISLEDSCQWYRSSTIAQGATGPACLYQPTPDNLMALVPTVSGIGRYRFHAGSKSWMSIAVMPGMTGPACVYSIPTLGEIVFHAFIRDGYEINEKICRGPEFEDTSSPLPPSFDHIRDTLYHKVFRTIPLSIASQSNSALGDSPNTEAIVFHASGTGYQDAWIVLHWSLPAGNDEWVVTSVVLKHVIGMPI